MRAAMCVLVAMFAISQSASSQTIQSNPGGGPWNNPATWVGGVVPTAGNDVVIRGTVNLTQDATVRFLTVDPGGVLQNEGWWTSVIATGSVTNNGTVRDNPNGYNLTVIVFGDLSTNGTWTGNASFTGDKAHALAVAPGSTWSVNLGFSGGDVSSTVTAASDLRLERPFTLAGHELRMGSRRLAFAGEGSVVAGTVTTTGVVEGQNSSGHIAFNTEFVGTPTLEGMVRVRENVTFTGTVTVVGTLENADWWQTVTVNGLIVNQGTLRNSPAGYGLTIAVNGDATNNGTWDFDATTFGANVDHRLTLAAGRAWDSAFRIADGDVSSTLVAQTDQRFGGELNLSEHELRMAGHRLVFAEGGAVTRATVTSTGVIEGLHDAGYIAFNATFAGSPTLAGIARFREGVTFTGPVVVEGTVENADWWQTITFKDRLVNNGTIRTSPRGYTLNVALETDATNNGVWSFDTAFLGANREHRLYLAAGQTWDSAFRIADGDLSSSLTAMTDQRFAGEIHLSGRELRMGAHRLAFAEGGFVTQATVTTEGIIEGLDDAGLVAHNTTFAGTPTLAGVVRVRENVVFTGSVVVTGALENADWWQTVTIHGQIVNNGTIRNSPRGYSLQVDAFGSVSGSGSWNLDLLNLMGTGLRNVYAPVMTGTVRVSGPGVILVGENFLDRLEVADGASVLLDAGATLRLTRGVVNARLVNHGLVRSDVSTTSGGTFDVYHAQFRLAAGALDSLTVIHGGNQAPETYGNAVRTIWQLRSVPPGSANTLEFLRLYYDDFVLGSNSEDALEVYFSEDDGVSWRQISTSANIERNPQENWVRLNGGPAHGMFVVSSQPDPISVIPTIVTSIIGRSQIRVGPPNRYTVHYANNSNVASGDFILQLFTGGGARIRSVEPSAPAGADRQSIPLDSLTYDGEDEVAYLWVTSMAPREERTFDVILGAIPDAPGKRAEIRDPDELITFFTIAAIWTGKALIAAYFVDVTVQLAEEVWRPVASCESITEALGGAIKDSFSKVTRRWTGYEKPLKAIGDAAQDEVLKRVGANIPGKDFVEVAGAFYVRGPQRYLNGGFKVKDCTGKDKDINFDTSQNDLGLQKVTSWDPNEKVAPAGFGPQGFITSASRMTYQILFENKKEATAPAWSIVIDDTLSTDFDPSTVVFESASHPGFALTVTGQRLHWAVEGIELPPNVTPPEGEGYVTFSVMPKSGLASGTPLRNRAVIVFDLNRPIMTNAVVNTLDFTAPTTTLEALPAESVGDSLTVRWAAADGPGESGAYSTTVFASMDGGGFVPVGSSTKGFLRVGVRPSHTYEFYAMSRDAVGNVEVARPASVSTTVTGSTANEDLDLPGVFALAPAYPNPFNPVTTISYAVPAGGPARMVVYDATGRLVATILDSTLPAGRGLVRWDASRLASGVYFYRFTQGPHERTRAVVLMR